MKTLRTLILALNVVLLVTCTARAQAIGEIMSYQGKITNADGTPVSNGTYPVTIKINENGVQKTSQTLSVATLGGVFSTFLSVGTLKFDPAKSYTLSVTANGTTSTQPIASVPIAKSANDALNATSAKTADNAVNAISAKTAEVADVANLLSILGPDGKANYKIQRGTAQVTSFEVKNSWSEGFVEITYPQAFAEMPILFCTIGGFGSHGAYGPTSFLFHNRSTTGCLIQAVTMTGGPIGISVEWIAIGK